LTKLQVRETSKGCPPELFILMGVNVFVALSLLTSVFDSSFPKSVPYVFQIAALAGFGEIWVNYALLSFVEVRFWCSMLYLIVTLMAVVAVNVYIAVNKRRWSAAGVFLGAFTIPTIFTSFLLVSANVNGLAIWMPPFPTVPFEAIYMVFASCIVIFGLSVFAYFEPDRIKMFFRRVGCQHAAPNPCLSPVDDPKEDKEEGGGSVGESG